MGDVMDSTVIHINSGKAYGRQGKAPKGLNFQHSTLLHAISAYLSDSIIDNIISKVLKPITSLSHHQ